MRTYLGDVGEVLPSCVGECTVHVLLQPRLDEEEGVKDFDMAEALLLQKLEGLPLIIGSNYELFNCSQNTNTGLAPQDCRGCLLLGCTSSVARVHRHVIPGG